LSKPRLDDAPHRRKPAWIILRFSPRAWKGTLTARDRSVHDDAALLSVFQPGNVWTLVSLFSLNSSTECPALQGPGRISRTDSIEFWSIHAAPNASLSYYY
jgi:hypothetical protein